MKNYIQYVVWDEITYSHPNLNGAPLKFGNGPSVITFHAEVKINLS